MNNEPRALRALSAFGGGLLVDNNETIDTFDRLYRLQDVERLVGLKRTKIKDLVAEGAFPKPVPLSDGGRAIAWLESELRVWQRARIAKRDQVA